jgi:hypothetical protein
VAVALTVLAVLLGVAPAAAQAQVSTAAAQTRLSPSSWNAGSVFVGHDKSITITLTNVGSQTLNIGNVSVSEDRDFGGGGGRCQGARLRPRSSCTTTVRFSPTTPIDSGTRTATLFFSDATRPSTLAQVPLRGTAMSPAQVSPAAAWDFGTIGVGLFAFQFLTLTNVTGQVLSFGDVTASGHPDFEVDPGDCAQAQLAAGQSCTVTVFFEPTFTPPDDGDRFTVVSFEDAVTSMVLVEIPVHGTATP